MPSPKHLFRRVTESGKSVIESAGVGGGHYDADGNVMQGSELERTERKAPSSGGGVFRILCKRGMSG